MFEECFGMKAGDEWQEFYLVGLEVFGLVRKAEVNVIRSWSVELFDG